MPIIMHDYLTGGFTANTTWRSGADNGMLLHIHRAMRCNRPSEEPRNALPDVGQVSADVRW